MANMLTMPGSATTKNKRHGRMVAYISSVFVLMMVPPDWLSENIIERRSEDVKC